MATKRAKKDKSRITSQILASLLREKKIEIIAHDKKRINEVKTGTLIKIFFLSRIKPVKRVNEN